VIESELKANKEREVLVFLKDLLHKYPSGHPVGGSAAILPLRRTHRGAHLLARDPML
jgi:hypothetical protein